MTAPGGGALPRCAVCGEEDETVRARRPVGTDPRGQRFDAAPSDVVCCLPCAQWACSKLGLTYVPDPADEAP